MSIERARTSDSLTHVIKSLKCEGALLLLSAEKSRREVHPRMIAVDKVLRLILLANGLAEIESCRKSSCR